MSKNFFNNQFNNRSLKQSLKVTFSTIILIFTLIFILLSLMINSIMSHIKFLQTSSLPLMESAQSAAYNQLATQNTMYKLCLSDSLDSQHQYVIEQSTYDMALQKDLKYLLEHAPTYKSSITKIQNLLQEALSYRNQAVLYCKQNASTKALLLLELEYFPRMTSVQGELSSLYRTFSNQNTALLTRYTKQAIFTFILVLIGFIFMLLTSFKLIKRLIIQIQAPLNQIGTAMSEMAQGQLDFNLSYTATNEFGKLADEMRYMGHELLNYISNISEVLTDLAHKNYNTEVSIHYNGMFLPIQKALCTIINELNEVITSFHQTADQITQSATQMLSTSKQLSESSVVQSASVQEFAATMENLASKVQENADSTLAVSHNTLKLEEKLTEGNAATHQLLALMDSTTSSAQEIQKIITLIEKISRQTHLLALNSTIEASRSGQNGKAFAVLAHEMGELAVETTQAVQTTKTLITDTLHNINESNDSIKHTAAMILEATQLSQTISQHIQTVALATTNQSDAIKTFNASLEEITCIIDDNTKIAVELAKKGNHLSDSASLLTDKLSTFNLKKL